MNYIIIQHSSLVNKIARQFLEEKNINFENCLFLDARNFKSHYKNAIDFPYYYVNFKIRFWKNWGLVKKFQHWINEKNDHKKFYAIIPHSYINSCKLLTEHPQCIAYYYIEEGTLSYLTLEEQKATLQLNYTTFFLRNLLFISNFGFSYFKGFKPFNYAHKKFKGSISLSKQCFIDAPTKEIIKLPFKTDKQYDGIKYVIPLTSLPENNLCSINNYFKALEQLFDLLGKHTIKIVHIKLHPLQSEGTKYHRQYCSFFSKVATEKNIQLIYLKNTDSIEEIANTTKATFFNTIGSIAIYANACGSVVYNYSSFLTKIDTTFAEHYKNTPSVLLTTQKHISALSQF